MSLFRVLLSAGVVATLAPTALAYGRDGHRLVCGLAYRFLQPEPRAEVDRLIAQDPQFDHFRDVCSWADQVRAPAPPAPATLCHLLLAACPPAPIRASPRQVPRLLQHQGGPARRAEVAASFQPGGGGAHGRMRRRNRQRCGVCRARPQGL